MSERFDLDAYLARVGLSAPLPPTRATLDAVHRGQALAIPFENLDIQLGRPIALDPDGLQAKLVRGRRGGYCFELNSLLLHALRALGFEPEARGARVRPGGDRVLPRTHLVLVVPMGGAPVLADVGFGGTGPVEPVPVDGRPHTQHGFTYRVVDQGPQHVLQLEGAAGWQDLYSFDAAPFLPVDVEVAHWFTSTHPRSRFVETLTVQRPTLEARFVLRNLEYSVLRPTGTDVASIARHELVPLLERTFGIRLPADAEFRALDRGAPGPP